MYVDLEVCYPKYFLLSQITPYSIYYIESLPALEALFKWYISSCTKKYELLNVSIWKKFHKVQRLEPEKLDDH